MPSERRYLTLRVVAEMLGLDVRSVAELVRATGVATVTRGNRTAIVAADLKILVREYVRTVPQAERGNPLTKVRIRRPTIWQQLTAMFALKGVVGRGHPEISKKIDTAIADLQAQEPGFRRSLWRNPDGDGGG